MQAGCKRRKHQQGRLAVAHSTVAAQRRALHGWALSCEAAAPRRAELGMLVLRLQARTGERVLRGAWALWQKAWQHGLVDRAQLSLAAQHHRAALQARALRHWRSWLLARTAQQGASLFALRHWALRKCRQVLVGWRSRIGVAQALRCASNRKRRGVTVHGDHDLHFCCESIYLQKSCA